jgi:hypothetical protein
MTMQRGVFIDSDEPSVAITGEGVGFNPQQNFQPPSSHVSDICGGQS